jgi:hypothetical protein
MSLLFDASLEFPNVVFTIALGIVLVYWLFVLLGALDVDLFGHGDVGGHDIGVGGHDVGDVGGHDVGGHDAGGGGDGHDAGHDGDADGDSGGIWHGLGLGDVPLTISVSMLALTSWVISMLGTHYVLDDGALRYAMLPIALVLALPISAVLVRPLRPIFKMREGKSNKDYEGAICTITTGSVDDKFGQATIEDGGTVLVIAVRCDKPGALKRGDKALVIEFDPERQAYVVEPSTDMLPAGESAS